MIVEDPIAAALPVTLRPTVPSDLDVFFQQQLDPQANYLAAFTAKVPADRQAFDAHWAKILSDPGITLRTILYGDQIAGSVAVHGWFGDPEITYWLGREYWGKGIATCAVKQFLEIMKTRPLCGRTASDNYASQRVLQKNGFVLTGSEKGFSNARGCELEELIFILK